MTMADITCPYCGSTLKANARGCPRCAWNREAENKIDRVVLRVILPATLLVLFLGLAFAVFYMR